MDAKQLNERCEMIGTAARLMAIKACSETRISLPQVLEKCLRLAHSLAEQILMQEHHAATEAAQREQDERWRAEDEKLYGPRTAAERKAHNEDPVLVEHRGREIEFPAGIDPGFGRVVDPIAGKAIDPGFASLPSGEGAID